MKDLYFKIIQNKVKQNKNQSKNFKQIIIYSYNIINIITKIQIKTKNQCITEDKLRKRIKQDHL